MTLVDVEASVARVAEVKPWEFLDRLSEKDARRSLELYALLRGSSQVGLLTLVTIRIRELICCLRIVRASTKGVGKLGFRVPLAYRDYLWSCPVESSWFPPGRPAPLSAKERARRMAGLPKFSSSQRSSSTSWS